MTFRLLSQRTDRSQALLHYGSGIIDGQFSLSMFSRMSFKVFLLKSFNVVFFLRITTLLTCRKSTLLLKNKCFVTTIYMETQCLQANETQHYWKGKCLGSERWSRERVALIKSLIYARWKETRLRSLNLSADKSYDVLIDNNIWNILMKWVILKLSLFLYISIVKYCSSTINKQQQNVAKSQ